MRYVFLKWHFIHGSTRSSCKMYRYNGSTDFLLGKVIHSNKDRNCRCIVKEGKANPLWSKPQIVKEQAWVSHAFLLSLLSYSLPLSSFLAYDQWLTQSRLVLQKFVWLSTAYDSTKIHTRWMPHFKFSWKKFRLAIHCVVTLSMSSLLSLYQHRS